MSEIEWQSWPLVEGGGAGRTRAIAVTGLLGLVWVVLLLSLPLTTALLLNLLLLMALLPYFLPARYRVSSEALVITRGFLSDRREWADFKECRLTPRGYLLLPYSRQPAFLPYPSDSAQKEAVTKLLAGRFNLSRPHPETNM